MAATYLALVDRYTRQWIANGTLSGADVQRLMRACRGAGIAFDDVATHVATELA